MLFSITESSPKEKDLEVLVDEKLSMTQQNVHLQPRKPNTPGCIQSRVAAEQGRGFCPSALLR